MYMYSINTITNHAGCRQEAGGRLTCSHVVKIERGIRIHSHSHTTVATHVCGRHGQAAWPVDRPAGGGCSSLGTYVRVAVSERDTFHGPYCCFVPHAWRTQPNTPLMPVALPLRMKRGTGIRRQQTQRVRHPSSWWVATSKQITSTCTVHLG